jgi:hypothetical protein
MHALGSLTAGSGKTVLVVRPPAAVGLPPFHSQGAMKKSQRPFTFEVKRSRLPSQQASTFQRYVVAPDLAGAGKAPAASHLRVTAFEEATPLTVPTRILPSLSGEKLWREEPVAQVPVASDLLETCETLAMPEEEASPPVAHVMALDVELPSNEERSKRVRRSAKAPQDLPRGERWKRRIPQVAW